MNRKIKLIWDFRGMDADKTAAHHESHLKEYITREALETTITGNKKLTDIHSVAFMVVNDTKMIQVRDALLPHRGEVYEDIV